MSFTRFELLLEMPSSQDHESNLSDVCQKCMAGTNTVDGKSTSQTNVVCLLLWSDGQYVCLQPMNLKPLPNIMLNLDFFASISPLTKLDQCAFLKNECEMRKKRVTPASLSCLSCFQLYSTLD